jgi:hypothetical protein
LSTTPRLFSKPAVSFERAFSQRSGSAPVAGSATEAPGACIDTRCASLQTQLPLLGRRLRSVPPASAGVERARLAASAAGAPTETPSGSTSPWTGHPVSQRWVAWVGLSDEATRESVRGGPAGLKQSRHPPQRTRLQNSRPQPESIRTASAVGRSGASRGSRREAPCVKGSYLVDPASSHMLVSKIKPCMSKYKLLYTVKLRMAH